MVALRFLACTKRVLITLGIMFLMSSTLSVNAFSFHHYSKLSSFDTNMRSLELNASPKEEMPVENTFLATRRNSFYRAAASSLAILIGFNDPVMGGSLPEIDVNNALAREYTAFPGLYPTIATKIVNGAKKRCDLIDFLCSTSI